MHVILDSNSRAAPPFEALTDSEVIEGYNQAMDAYEAAKAGVGCRVETFTNLLVSERILASHGITAAPTSPADRASHRLVLQGDGNAREIRPLARDALSSDTTNETIKCIYSAWLAACFREAVQTVS
jgi:hypothetical protein